MEVKPTKGLKVKVNAKREAIFEEESISVKNVSLPNDGTREGVLTGTTLAGFCEVEMPRLDGGKHWYPVGDLLGEGGEQVVEEEIKIELDEDEGPEEE